ncbi:response regulator [Natronococcus sp. JC468]|uniref:response regulator n=1 Tax=Natronococcus sp. JC468 TaxID=1961921 RepID=UPI00143AD08D|nr:response regulator [Natronococcus sp. JC468]NKE34668.1 response regulator [Natronococcus sp. JC468]
MSEQAETDTEILLVEDNPGDVRLVEEALRETASTLHVTRDGKETLNFLRRQSEFHGAPHLDTVLLDLNLPKIDGTQVLDTIRSDPALDHVRVIIVTSAQERDVDFDREEIDEDDFITKPADPDEFMTLVRTAVFA